MSYLEILKTNREEIIDIANDSIRYTNVTLKTVMNFLVENEEMFNSLPTCKFFGDMGKFGTMCKNAVNQLISFKHDTKFETIQNNSRMAQMKSAFN